MNPPLHDNPIRVQIVEDESIVALDLVSTLRRRGWGVVGPAASGEESIARADAERPDLVLMDIRLRGAMNGLEAARVIRSRWGIPIVFLTAQDDITADPVEPQSPLSRVLKPFDEEDLERTIARELTA